ncbi:MAG TPA: hypothetical protein VME24_13560 [Alphaproteobacteria bacterium]|nr:hypothetical protein [Alphaproteobacteria bacterium]
MKTTFPFEARSKAHITVPISEFSFATYPVRINRSFPCFPGPNTAQSNPLKQWLARIFQALAGFVCQSATGDGLQNDCRTAGPTRLDKTINRLRIVEDDTLASPWTARAFAARVFIGFQHPKASWITGRLPVALWPKALKCEIEQAGFAKSVNPQVFAA